VFEIRMLKRIFGPQKDEVIGCWGKLHNEELQELYYSPSIVRIIKTRRMIGHGIKHAWRRREMRI
jgi:hypothetical protein